MDNSSNATTPAAVFIHPSSGTVMAVDGTTGNVAPATAAQIQAIVNAGQPIQAPVSDAHADAIVAAATPATAQSPSSASLAGASGPVTEDNLPSGAKVVDTEAPASDGGASKNSTTMVAGASTDLVSRMIDLERRISALESKAGATVGGDASGSIVSRLETIERQTNAVFSKYFSNEIATG